MRGQNVTLLTKVIEVEDQEGPIEGEARVKEVLMDRPRALTVKSCPPKLGR